jgi:hypothetical protein
LTARTQEIVAKAASQGLMPLEYMLAVLRDESQPHDERFKAAINAAPYMHPRLASTELKGDPAHPIETVSRIELVAPEIHNGAHPAAAQAAVGLFRPS